MTRDVCSTCNSTLGSEVDHAFLDDGPTVTAAIRAGIPAHVLWTHYRGTISTPSGGTIETSVRRGISSVVPQFNQAFGALIGDRDGRFDPRQVEALTAKTVAGALGANPGRDPVETRARVEAMVSKVLGGGGEVMLFDATIGQGLRAFVVEARPVVRGTNADPILVERAAAKIVYEALRIIAPLRFQRPMREILVRIREFVLGRGTEERFLNHRILDAAPSPEHKIRVYAEGGEIGCEVVLFGAVRWALPMAGLTRFGTRALVADFERVVPNKCVWQNDNRATELPNHTAAFAARAT